mmetsp:Transcript_181280/g.575318  ORF Transcript_181280/g.575318 Transcript_181280/m.575318 type:complete len:247 (-) Transcript_181280:529-1269(-)
MALTATASAAVSDRSAACASTGSFSEQPWARCYMPAVLDSSALARLRATSQPGASVLACAVDLPPPLPPVEACAQSGGCSQKRGGKIPRSATPGGSRQQLLREGTKLGVPEGQKTDPASESAAAAAAQQKKLKKLKEISERISKVMEDSKGDPETRHTRTSLRASFHVPFGPPVVMADEYIMGPKAGCCRLVGPRHLLFAGAARLALGRRPQVGRRHLQLQPARCRRGRLLSDYGLFEGGFGQGGE